MIFHRSVALLMAFTIAGCAPSSIVTEHRAARKSARTARGKAPTPEAQAALYLQAAAGAAPGLGSGTEATAARETYNKATAKLAVLLHSADGGRLWNRPVTVGTGGDAYRLHFEPGNHKKSVWAPEYFTSLLLASDVNTRAVKRRDVQAGVGGALVGVRKKSPREPFAPVVGLTAPVTATLDFKGRDATLALRDPSEAPAAAVAGKTRPLAADYSAPIGYYPAPNELFEGLMGALRVSRYMHTTGMYMLEPYDPDRIPVIFVHGLISTARMWRNVINEVEMDPELRGRFQFWVFNYPTGNPVSYSALRFREELAKQEKLHGFPHGFVLVGHSMGGIVSRMQAVTLDRAAWDRAAPSVAKRVFKDLPTDSLVHRALIFDANPKLERTVFICTPHLGSEMAIGGIGEIAMRLIALPASLTATVTKSMGNTLSVITGNNKVLPNSITSLSPRNPTLKVISSVPMKAPYHTILGDRGRGDSPHSSDGVVPYWSSHVDGAQSEKIVPGPHGSCELPQTIEELKRILHLHLKKAGR